MKISRAAWLGWALAAAACAWPFPKADPTQFYVLESRPPAEAARKNRPRVELAGVEVASYLKNPRMAIRRRENEIDYAEFRRWAEPLPQGIARVIGDDLAPTLDVRTNDAQGRPSEYRLSVQVSAFEGLLASTGAASIRVQAVWELRPPPPAVPVRGRFEAAPAAWDGKDYERLARLLSDSLAVLCVDVARAIPTR
jgi:uncharacterized lipoprotein YmbA